VGSPFEALAALWAASIPSQRSQKGVSFVCVATAVAAPLTTCFSVWPNRRDGPHACGSRVRVDRHRRSSPARGSVAGRSRVCNGFRAVARCESGET
jgi:hypothetical protein